MSVKKYVVAIDQGTTSTRCMVFIKEGRPVASFQMEHTQIYPKPGWVEHDAMEIWSRTQDVIRGALGQKGIMPEEIAAIGITNQRETTVIWDKVTGRPIYNAIVWQCMRTQAFCTEWQKQPGWKQNIVGEGIVKDITGLLINPYFSGTKIKWILDNVPGRLEPPTPQVWVRDSGRMRAIFDLIGLSIVNLPAFPQKRSVRRCIPAGERPSESPEIGLTDFNKA